MNEIVIRYFIFFFFWLCADLYHRSSKLLVILLKDQLFHENIVLSVRRPKSPENLKATSGNVFVTRGGAEKQ